MDIYHKPFDLVLPDDTTSYRTLCGSIFSIITIIIISTYASLKVVALVNRTEYKVQEREYEDHFTDQDIFDTSHGI